MLEIFGIIMLCNKNRANALRRGRNPSGFVALTICLWLGLEFIGAMIGGAAGLEYGAYGLGILFAVIGGVTSYLIAKNCSPGNYVPQAQHLSQSIVQNAQPLAAPAQILLVRESSMVGALVRWDYTLNGQPVGSLGNGGSVTLTTLQRQNILQARDAYGTEIQPLVFDVMDGSVAEIHFKANKFLLDQSRGFLPPTPVERGVPQAAFCVKCGAALTEGAAFCAACGESRYMPQQAQAVSAGAYQPVAQPVYGAPAAPMAAPDLQPPNTLRAVWAAGILLTAWILLYLLQGIFEGRLLYNADAAFFMIDALLGAGVFLICQRGVLQKCMGGAAGLIAALLSAFSGYAQQLQAKFYGSFSLLELLDFTAPYVMYQFLQMLLCAALLLGGAWVTAYLLRVKPEKQRLLAAGGVAAGVYLLFTIYRTIAVNGPYFFNMNPLMFFTMFLNILADTGVVFLAVWFLWKLCTMERTGVQLRGPGLVWVWFAVFGMAGSVILVAIQGLTPSSGMAYTSGMLLALSGLIGYILLLCKKRIGLYVLLAGTGLMLGSQFFAVLTPMLSGLPQYASLFVGSIIGAVNPLLGYLAVRAADRRPYTAYAVPGPYGNPVRQRVSGFDKFTAIFVISAGGILFLLPVPFLMMGDSFVEGMAICMLIGLLIAGFGIVCTAMQRTKSGTYPMGLKVACIILFVLCAIVMVLLCIGLISSL